MHQLGQGDDKQLRYLMTSADLLEIGDLSAKTQHRRYSYTTSASLKDGDIHDLLLSSPRLCAIVLTGGKPSRRRLHGQVFIGLGKIPEGVRYIAIGNACHSTTRRIRIAKEIGIRVLYDASGNADDVAKVRSDELLEIEKTFPSADPVADAFGWKLAYTGEASAQVASAISRAYASETDRLARTFFVQIASDAHRDGSDNVFFDENLLACVGRSDMLSIVKLIRILSCGRAREAVEAMAASERIAKKMQSLRCGRAPEASALMKVDMRQAEFPEGFPNPCLAACEALSAARHELRGCIAVWNACLESAGIRLGFGRNSTMQELDEDALIGVGRALGIDGMLALRYDAGLSYEDIVGREL